MKEGAVSVKKEFILITIENVLGILFWVAAFIIVVSIDVSGAILLDSILFIAAVYLSVKISVEDEPVSSTEDLAMLILASIVLIALISLVFGYLVLILWSWLIPLTIQVLPPTLSFWSSVLLFFYLYFMEHTITFALKLFK